ncbi:LysE family translocator [Hamadaea tsunoensis]|uniref:LysE family translocator n=1 Tax=Hamadaea tsunoensis TaxID=53368 RepID=UPI0004156BC7|nr:LysE family translocator [Hamadaea tsunoensis]
MRNVAGFLLAVLPVIATPGASLALLTQRVAPGGARHGLPVILGTVTGLYLHATLAVAGLSAIVMRSSELFSAVRVAGAIYLVALGLWTLRTPRPAPRARWRPRGAYPQALLGNVLNPKAASIYLTLVPQFVDPRRPLGPQIFLLATAHALLIAVWLLGWTAVIVRVGHAIRSATFTVWVRRTTAAILIVLGLRAATT